MKIGAQHVNKNNTSVMGPAFIDVLDNAAGLPGDCVLMVSDNENGQRGRTRAKLILTSEQRRQLVQALQVVARAFVFLLLVGCNAGAELTARAQDVDDVD